MITTMPAPFREPEDKTLKWVMIFLVLSLLVHLLVIAGILIVTRIMPVPKLVVATPKEVPITLSLIPAPPMPPKPKKIFIPTQAQPNVPHTQQQVESANDTVLKSRAKTAHDNTSIMPEIRGKPKAPDLQTSPEIKAPQKPQVSTTQPTPRQAQPLKPAPPTPKPQMTTPITPRPLPPQPKPAPPRPQPPQPAIDPETGLPALAPLSAPTMSPPNQAQPLAPAPSQRQMAGSVHGQLGTPGDNSPAAMATDLGKYKQYIHDVVGSYWYPQVDAKFGSIGVGEVTIRYTIHSDGTISDVKVTEGDNFEILRSISQSALVSPAPFKPFTPAMIKEVGDSYSDECSFSVY